VVLGLASRGGGSLFGGAQASTLPAGGAGYSPAPTGGFFSNLMQSIGNIGAGYAGPGNTYGAGGLLQPINYNPVNYSPASTTAPPTAGSTPFTGILSGGGTTQAANQWAI